MTQDPSIPAATLIVMREASGHKPDILMVERAAAMAFAGGAIVFPGGRIDPADHALAAALGRPDDAAKVTAIRETIEESAVVAGVTGIVDPALGLILQQALIDGAPFADLLDAHDLALEFDALTAFARWMPAFKHARRFDTLFFLTLALPGAWSPRPQPGECEAALWASGDALLARIAAGTANAIFPTKRNLERIGRFAGIDEARADAAAHSIDTIIPWIEDRDGIPHVCIPHGRGYPVTAEPLSSAIRA